MVTQLKRTLPTIATIAAIALIVVAATRLMGQSSGGQLPRIDGKPNLSGIW